VKHEKIINNCLSFFKNKTGFSAIAMVGSAIKISNPNDIDLLFLVDSKKKAHEQINAFANDIHMKYVMYDDSYRFALYKNFELSIVPKNKKQFIMLIDKFLSGKDLNRVYKIWTVGGFFPETLINDLDQSKILWENNDRLLSTIKNNINLKKLIFLKKLKEQLTQEIYTKKAILIKKPIEGVYLSTLINDLKIAWLRYIFTNEEVFFPGLKRFQNNVPYFSLKSRKIISRLNSNKIKGFLQNDKISL